MKRVLMMILALTVVTISAYSANVVQEQSRALQTERLQSQLPKDSKKYMDGISPENANNFFGTAKEIIFSALEDTASAWKKGLKEAAILLTAVIICSLVSAFTEGKSQWAALLAGALTIGATCFGNMKTMVGLGKTTIEELSAFSKLLIPVMAGAGTAAGCPVSSNALYAGSILFLNIIVSFISAVLLPLVYCHAALSLADCALEQRTLRGYKKWIDVFMKKSLQIALFVFSGYLSLTGIISGNADALSVKAAKIAVSSAVPVVGGMLSDASETVIVSAKILRNSVGIFGMLAVLSIMIVPFLKIGIQYLILQATSLLSTAIAEKKLSGLIDAMASAMGYMLAMVGCCGLFTFISCICFMKVTVL